MSMMIHNIPPAAGLGINAQRPAPIDSRTRTIANRSAPGVAAIDPIAHYRKCRGLAQELVANGVVDARLTVDDLCCLSLARLQELTASATRVAPVLSVAGGSGARDEFAGYSINEHLGAGK